MSINNSGDDKRVIQPLLSAILITGKDPLRIPLALAAIESYKLQTYPNKELVILNTGPRLIDNSYDPKYKIYEHFPPKDLTLGDLRNLAFHFSNGEWMVQFDDDDWSHPKRLEYMASHISTEDAAVLLGWQIRYDLEKNVAYYYKGHPKIGIHGTILHNKNIAHRYPGIHRGEDSIFLNNFSKKIILDNNPTNKEGEDASLYIRLYHGCNTWNREHIMGDYSDKNNILSLLPHHQDYLKDIVNKYYLNK